MQIRSKAYSKLNLFLEVTGKRRDGYHELYSLAVFLDLADEITIESDDVITCGGNIEDNIMLKAAELLAMRYGVDQGARITYSKNIPMGGGLGGGSADAAAVLIMLNELWQLNIQNNDLYKIGLELGADVPVCLYSQLENKNSAIFKGVGEIIEDAPPLPVMHFVLVNPNRPLATAEVFKYFRYEGQVLKPYFEGENLNIRRNDLEKVSKILMPEIATIIDELAKTRNCTLARMTGSGATCFGIYENAADADAAALEISNRHPEWRVVTAKLKD